MLHFFEWYICFTQVLKFDLNTSSAVCGWLYFDCGHKTSRVHSISVIGCVLTNQDMRNQNTKNYASGIRNHLFFPKSDLKTLKIHGIFMWMHLFTLTKILNIQIVFNIFRVFHCCKLVIQISMLNLHNEIDFSLFFSADSLYLYIALRIFAYFSFFGILHLSNFTHANINKVEN